MDNREKGHQVDLMKNIYRRATVVNIWLGEEDSYSGIGMATLGTIFHERPHHRQKWQDIDPELVRAGVKNIMAREWWTRIWVVQEFAMSQTTRLMCGNFFIEWQARPNSVRNIIRNIKLAETSPQWSQLWLDENQVSLSVIIDLLTFQLRLCEVATSTELTEVKHKPTLLDVMYETRNKHCTDRRDKVFAVMGIGGEIGLQPDYNMSVDEVWEHMLAAMSKESDRTISIGLAETDYTMSVDEMWERLLVAGWPKESGRIISIGSASTIDIAESGMVAHAE